MTPEEAREVIERLMPLQERGVVMPCPRCGEDKMLEKASMNALSRHANVYVCAFCGMDEAVRDWIGKPLPLNEWALARGL